MEIPKPPVARFTFTNGGCTAPCKVVFTSASENAVGLEWDFGDGSAVERGETVTHEFKGGGDFQVKLVAKSAEGGSQGVTQVVNVKGPAAPPVAGFVPDKETCEAPCEVTFENSSTGATSYSWDFKDGDPSTETSPKHTFANPGTYVVTLTAKGPGGEDTETKTITIVGKTVNAFSIKSAYNYPTDMISDASGNIYICGATQGITDFGSGKTASAGYNSTQNTDFYVAKYSPSGECLWAFVNGSGGNDHASGIAIDNVNNVYVTGYIGGTPRVNDFTFRGGLDGFVVKLNNSGVMQWFKNFGGAASDFGRDIGFFQTSEGPRVYVTGVVNGQARVSDIYFGQETRAADGQDISFVFYNADNGDVGQPLIIGGAGPQSVESMVIDHEGSAYFIGSFDAAMTFTGSQGRLTSYGRTDAFVAKWSLQKGDWEWARGMGSSGDDYGYDLAIDKDRNVYTTGAYVGSIFPLGVGSKGDLGVFVAKWPPNGGDEGKPYWGRSGCNDGLDDYAGGIAIGRDGNVIVAGSYQQEGKMPFGGTSFQSRGSTDMIIAELHHSQDNGGPTGRFQASGGGSGAERALRVCVAPDGTVYCAGSFEGTATFNGVNLTNPNITRNTYIVKYKY